MNIDVLQKSQAHNRRIVVNLFELHNDCSGAWLEKFQSDFYAKNIKSKKRIAERLHYLKASENALQKALRLEKKIQQLLEKNHHA